MTPTDSPALRDAKAWLDELLSDHDQTICVGVYDELVEALSPTTQPAERADANVEAVREKLLARSQVGIAKYGTTTQRGDLSHADWLLHLQEELLDAAVYVQAALRATQQPNDGGEGL